MSKHVLNNTGERHGEINKGKKDIDNNINDLNKAQEFEQKTNEGVINKKENEFDKIHFNNQEKHKNQTENIREVTKEVEDNQWVRDKNFVQTSLENKYKNKI